MAEEKGNAANPGKPAPYKDGLFRPIADLKVDTVYKDLLKQQERA